MTSQTWVLLALLLTVYAIGVSTGWVAAKRRTRDRVMRELTADPAGLRLLATRVEDARFRAAEADATRHVGGLAPREP